MPHRLKKGQENFEVVDGPMAGRKFERGVSYDEIPPQEKQRFETVRPPAPPAGKPDRKKAAGPDGTAEVKEG